MSADDLCFWLNSQELVQNKNETEGEHYHFWLSQLSTLLAQMIVPKNIV